MKTLVKVIRLIGFVFTWVTGFVGCVLLNEYLLDKVGILADKIKGGDN